VIAKQLGKIKETVAGLHRKYPHIYFLYYFPTLNMDSFQYSDLENFNYIVVGEHRIRGFSEIMLTLSKSYWKKIPYDKFDLVYEKLSPRLKKVMNYIETHGLKECGTSNIARYLTISAGYFSQEFKRETNLNFRDFMQKLLDHYEYIILNKLNLSAKSASQILGYSELSSFSRSFKKRKGYPPSHYKNLEYIEAE